MNVDADEQTLTERQQVNVQQTRLKDLDSK